MGLLLLFYIIYSNQDTRFFQSVSDVLKIEQSVSLHMEEIYILFREENELFYTIKTSGEKSEDVSDMLQQVLYNITKTKEMYQQLDQYNQEIQALYPKLKRFSNQIKEPEKKEWAVQLVNLEKERWTCFDRIYKQYQEILKLQEGLYHMLEETEISLVDINNIIDQIEKKREVFNRSICTFNNFGEQINALLVNLAK